MDRRYLNVASACIATACGSFPATEPTSTTGATSATGAGTSSSSTAASLSETWVDPTPGTSWSSGSTTGASDPRDTAGDAPGAASSTGTTATGSTGAASTGTASTGTTQSETGGSSTSGSGSAGGETGQTGSSTGVPSPTLVTYRVTLDVTWSERTHPGAVPEDAHLSWLGGGTHTPEHSLWAVGRLASPGIVQMAETGVTAILSEEVEAAIDTGDAYSALGWPQWFCPPATVSINCAEPVVEFTVSVDFPAVTLVTMLGPSPDLFVGTQGLPLWVDGTWLEEVVVDLHPFDGGTRSDTDWTMNGALEEPPLPIVPIESLAQHPVGPASLGTMTFELL